MNYLLYIHPDTLMLMDPMVPVGVVPLMNASPLPVRGRLWNEVTDAEIAGATVVALDLHWYPALPSYQQLARRVRRVAPRTPIITGGYTASAFAPELVRRGLADYVVTGDADKPFPLLVTRLLDGGETAEIPNVVSARQDRPAHWSLTQECFDVLNYRDYDFLPALKAYARVIQEKALRRQARQSFFPYIIINRGCNTDCPACMGSAKLHKIWSGRGALWRSPAAVKQDITHFSGLGYSFLCIYGEFVGCTPQAYQQEILAGPYETLIHHRFCHLPPPDDLRRLLAAFRGGCLEISSAAVSEESLLGRRFEETVEVLNSDGRYTARLCLDYAVLGRKRDVARRLLALRRRFPFTCSSASRWLPDIPIQPGAGLYLGPTEFDRYLKDVEKNMIDRANRFIFRHTNDYDSIYRLAHRADDWTNLARLFV
ncbi:MAG: hypothetical protein ABIH03_17180 [Pseudomonadota bacterium]